MAKGTVNKVIILGRLGQDPDVRATASGTQVVNLNVATNELGPKDAAGNRGEAVTEWHRIVIFGRMAENAAQYLQKGSQVYIEGRLQTRKWQDQSGQDRYSTEIVANEMQFIGGGQNQGQQPAQQGGGFQAQPQQNGGFNQQASQQYAQQSGGFQGQQRQQSRQQQSGGFQQQPQQNGGFQQQGGSMVDFDDDIPFS